MTETTKPNPWRHALGDLFDLAVLVLLGFALFGRVEDRDWPWAAVTAATLLLLGTEHAANKIVRAIEERP